MKNGWPNPVKASKRNDTLKDSKGDPEKTGTQPGPFTGPLNKSNTWLGEDYGEMKNEKIG